MKTIKSLIITFYFVQIGIFYSCSDNSTEPPITSEEIDYFPIKTGSVYIYDVAIFDSVGNITSGS